MKNVNESRIEKDISFWLDRENALKGLFKNEVVNERHFQIEKLKFFNQVQNKYKGTTDPGEKITLNVLNGEIKKLERQLYPNIVTRLLARLQDAAKQFIKERQSARQRARVPSQPLSFNPKTKEKLTSNETKISQQQKQGTSQTQGGQKAPENTLAPNRNQVLGVAVRNEKNIQQQKQSPEKQVRHKHRLQ